MKLIGRLICLYSGHRRGKLVHADESHNYCACPRCGRRKQYKRKQTLTAKEEPK